MSPRFSDPADDTAAAWVARMDSDAWGSANEAELETWLSQDRRRRGQLLQAQAAWLSLDRDSRAIPSASDPASQTRRPFAAIERRRFVLAGAGAIAASLIGGIVWVRSARTYSTALGEIRKMPLPDGSTATINSASEIDVRLAAGRREVRLASGEAWFQVAKDPSRPFLVEAGGVIAQAIGTAFSVRRFENGAEIIVTEGVVEGWAAQADGHRIRLTAGQHAYIGNNAAIRLVGDSQTDVDRTLAWRSGSIDLQGRSLADAIAEFNRYNQRKLVLADPALAAEQFDGIFRTDDPEGFSVAVRDSFATTIDTSDPAVIRIGGRAT